MSLKSRISTGVVREPYFFILHGPGGVGKSTLASKFPKPLFLETEKGSGRLDVSRLKLKDFDDCINILSDLNKDPEGYKTVVIDSVDWFEPFIFNKVIEISNKGLKPGAKKAIHIEQACGGFQKGYDFALTHWRELILFCEQLREERGFNIILVMHSDRAKINDPMQPEPYDSWELKVHKKASNLLYEAAQCVFFLKGEVLLTNVDEKGKRVKAIGDGDIILYTEERPSFKAKNRFTLPPEIPFPLKGGYEKLIELCERDIAKAPKAKKEKPKPEEPKPEVQTKPIPQEEVDKSTDEEGLVDVFNEYANQVAEKMKNLDGSTLEKAMKSFDKACEAKDMELMQKIDKRLTILLK